MIILARSDRNGEKTKDTLHSSIIRKNIKEQGMYFNKDIKQLCVILLHLIKYIHYNSVKAKLEGELNYNCSHNEYVKGKSNYTDIEDVLKIGSRNKFKKER